MSGSGDARIELRIDGVDAVIRVRSCTIDERIGAAVVAHARCTVIVGDARAELGQLGAIGRDATLTLRSHGVERAFALAVETIRDHGDHTEITLASPVSRLADTCDYRVFVDVSALDIAATVFGEHALTLDVRAQRQAPKRPHCVQAFESDLAFVTRLLAEEGMSWFPASDDAGTIRVTDAPETFPVSEIQIPLREESGLEVGRALHSARLRHQVTTEKASVREYDFERPMLELFGEAGAGSLAWDDFAGSSNSPDADREQAAIRLAEHQTEAVVLEGEATEPELAAGHVFTVSGAQEALDDDRWLVLSIHHEANERAGVSELTYQARFRAVPAATRYRPARAALHEKSPRGGVGTATVTGSEGQEIALDQHGRTRVLLRWDRRNEPGPTSSGFARVAQPQLSGSIFNPRVGWEELVGFSDVGGEIPVLLGRVYNAEQAPPTSLPAKKVESHFGTMTTPGGSSGNFLQLSDTAGKEGFSLNATGDHNEQTENDKISAITANQVSIVAGGRKVIIKERAVESVTGTQSLIVGGLRKVTVDSNYGLVAASEQVIVGGARLFRVGGDYLTKTPTFFRLVAGMKQEIGIEHQSVFTKGGSSLIVGGSVTTTASSESVGVAGVGVVKISDVHIFNVATYGLKVYGIYTESFASRAITASANVSESFGKATYSVDYAASYTGATVSIEGTSTLTIKAGGVTVSMTPGSITISGDYDSSEASVEEGVHRYG